MASEWSSTSLGSILKGGIRHGLYKPLEEFGRGTRVLKMGIQYSEDRIGPQAMSRVPLTDAEVKRFRAHVGDLLFSRTSMMSDGAGKCSLVVEHEEPFVFDGNILCGTPDTAAVDPRFVYYFFRAPRGKQAVAEIIAGTQSRSLSGTNLATLSMPCPPLPEQRAIAHILGTLDDKIDLNRRMNETLEAMAQALFKSWFVDFEPFRDQGMEDSPLGKIPRGWRVGRLGEVAEINERSITKAYPHQAIEYVDISSVTQGRLEATTAYVLSEAPSRAKRLVTHGDTIWSTVRPNRKSYLLIHHPKNNLVVSTGFVVLTPRLVSPSYLYSCATTDEFVDYLAYSADGSAYPAVLPNRFADAPMLLPPSEIVWLFDRRVASARVRVAANEEESRTLAAIRDALLPKLLSGEIRVKDAERVVERTP